VADRRSQGIRVTGAKELRLAIKRTQNNDLKVQLKEANRAAAEIVAVEAKLRAPKKSGALSGSIRALGSQAAGKVAAGSGKSRVYAPIQHFGNPKQNIKPNPFLYVALEEKHKEVFKAYERSMEKLVKDLSTERGNHL
jgi:hypothetical protein